MVGIWFVGDFMRLKWRLLIVCFSKSLLNYKLSFWIGGGEVCWWENGIVYYLFKLGGFFVRYFYYFWF